MRWLFGASKPRLVDGPVGG